MHVCGVGVGVNCAELCFLKTQKLSSLSQVLPLQSDITYICCNQYFEVSSCGVNKHVIQRNNHLMLWCCVRQAVSLLRPGGVLVYSTCTVTVEENEDQVAWLLHTFPDITLEQQVSPDTPFLTLLWNNR